MVLTSVSVRLRVTTNMPLKKKKNNQGKHFLFHQNDCNFGTEMKQK